MSHGWPENAILSREKGPGCAGGISNIHQLVFDLTDQMETYQYQSSNTPN